MGSRNGAIGSPTITPQRNWIISAHPKLVSIGDTPTALVNTAFLLPLTDQVLRVLIWFGCTTFQCGLTKLTNDVERIRYGQFFPCQLAWLHLEWHFIIGRIFPMNLAAQKGVSPKVWTRSTHLLPFTYHGIRQSNLGTRLYSSHLMTMATQLLSQLIYYGTMVPQRSGCRAFTLWMYSLTNVGDYLSPRMGLEVREVWVRLHIVADLMMSLYWQTRPHDNF